MQHGFAFRKRSDNAVGDIFIGDGNDSLYFGSIAAINDILFRKLECRGDTNGADFAKSKYAYPGFHALFEHKKNSVALADTEREKVIRRTVGHQSHITEGVKPAFAVVVAIQQSRLVRVFLRPCVDNVICKIKVCGNSDSVIVFQILIGIKFRAVDVLFYHSAVKRKNLIFRLS